MQEVGIQTSITTNNSNNTDDLNEYSDTDTDGTDNYYNELYNTYRKSCTRIMSKYNNLIKEYNKLEHNIQGTNYKLTLLENKYQTYIRNNYWSIYDNIFDRPENKDKLVYSFTIDEITYEEFIIIENAEKEVIAKGLKPSFGTSYGLYTDVVVVARYCDENTKAHKALDSKNIFKPSRDVEYIWSRTVELLIFSCAHVYLNITRYTDSDCINISTLIEEINDKK